MKHAQVTSGLTFLGTSFFLGITEIVTQETLDWILNFPPVNQAGSLISRLIDDMNEPEVKKDEETIDVASAMDCYMKQHGVSKEDAFSEFEKQIVHAWKDMNSLCLHPTEVPLPLVEIAFNMTPATFVMYQGNDGFTTAETETKAIISPVLVDPIPI